MAAADAHVQARLCKPLFEASHPRKTLSLMLSSVMIIIGTCKFQPHNLHFGKI